MQLSDQHPNIGAAFDTGHAPAGHKHASNDGGHIEIGATSHPLMIRLMAEPGRKYAALVRAAGRTHQHGAPGEHLFLTMISRLSDHGDVTEKYETNEILSQANADRSVVKGVANARNIRKMCGQNKRRLQFSLNADGRAHICDTLRTAGLEQKHGPAPTGHLIKEIQAIVDATRPQQVTLRILRRVSSSEQMLMNLGTATHEDIAGNLHPLSRAINGDCDGDVCTVMLT